MNGRSEKPKLNFIFTLAKFHFPFVENYFRDLLEIMCLKKVLCTSMQGLAPKYDP